MEQHAVVQQPFALSDFTINTDCNGLWKPIKHDTQPKEHVSGEQVTHLYGHGSWIMKRILESKSGKYSKCRIRWRIYRKGQSSDSSWSFTCTPCWYPTFDAAVTKEKVPPYDRLWAECVSD